MLLLLLLMFARVGFLLLGRGSLGGDGMGYVLAAQQLLLTGNLPPASSQPVSISLILAPIVALAGEASLVDYTAKPYPGYPGFVGVPVANAIFWAQVAMDAAVVAILLVEARRLLAGVSRPLLVIALTFVAWQPFTAQLTSHVLPDTPAMFFTFVGSWLLWRSYSDWHSLLGMSVGALFLGFAALARLDMLPVDAAVLAIVLMVVLRSRGWGGALSTAIPCGLMLVTPCTLMLALQYKSTGEFGYALMSEAAKRKAVPEGDLEHKGYMAWVRTWILVYNTDMLRFGMSAEGPGAWANWSTDKFPAYAFRDAAEKTAVGGILADWSRNGYSGDVDARFDALAAARRRGTPVFALGIVPAVRMAHYWLNIEGGRALTVSLGLGQRGGQFATMAVTPFRLLFVLLALLGAYVVWIERRSCILSGDGYALARLLSLVAAARTLELGLLGTVMASGLMEPRYVLPALPGVLLLAVIGWRRVTTGGAPELAQMGERALAARSEQNETLFFNSSKMVGTMQNESIAPGPPTKISVVIPVYNEEESVSPLFARLLPVLDGLNRPFEIIAVNDGSADKSAQMLAEAARQRAEIKIIEFRRNAGQTAAMMAGIDYATGDIIVTIDADLQNDPNDIPTLLRKLDEGFDVVSGWRKDRKDAAIRRNLVSRIANTLISKISGVRLRDYGCTLKAYRRDVLSGMRLYGEMHRFVPIYASWMGAKVIEIPVGHRARQFGQSKYGLNRTVKVVLDLLVVKFFSKYLVKPIYVFGGVGLWLIFGAIATFAYMLYLKLFAGTSMIQTPLPVLSALLLLLGVTSILMGLLAEIMVRTYFESQGRRSYAVRTLINFDKVH